MAGACLVLSACKTIGTYFHVLPWMSLFFLEAVVCSKGWGLVQKLVCSSNRGRRDLFLSFMDVQETLWSRNCVIFYSIQLNKMYHITQFCVFDICLITSKTIFAFACLSCIEPSFITFWQTEHCWRRIPFRFLFVHPELWVNSQRFYSEVVWGIVICDAATKTTHCTFKWCLMFSIICLLHFNHHSGWAF